MLCLPCTQEVHDVAIACCKPLTTQGTGHTENQWLSTEKLASWDWM